MDTRFESLITIFKDTEVAQRLLACSAEEAVTVLKEQYQLEFTVEELNDVAAGIQAALSNETSDELSDDKLEEVVGGAKGGAYYTGYYIGKAIKVVGAGIGIAAGLVGLGIVSW